MVIECRKCGQRKPASDFYKSQYSRISGLGECAECTKARVRKNRLANVDYYREYDRHRFRSDPRVSERHRRYQLSEAGREASRAAKARWMGRNPVKRIAATAVGNAVRDGRLEKPSHCENCGKSGRIHGHHDDYSKPLDVRWLCPKCHSDWHAENGEGANADAAESGKDRLTAAG